MPNNRPGPTNATHLPRFSFPQVCARRLERQYLTAPRSIAEPDQIAHRLCGVHAQVMSAAEVSIGLRLPGTTRTTVRDALWTDRSLVKTRGPRGTVHVLATSDLPLWTGAASALPKGNSLGLLTPEQVEEVVAAIADALREQSLTTDELTEAVVTRTGGWAGDPVMEAFQGKWPRWIAAQETAFQRGVMCFGPIRGRKATYTNPTNWLPGFRPTDASKALAEVVTRFLHTYGPATSAQFAQWLAVPNRWAADLFAGLTGSLEQVLVEQTPAWVVAGDTEPPADPPTGMRLLPYFDAYAVNSFPRPLVYPGRAAQRALAGGQAGNYPVLLIDGVVAGVWHQRRSGRKVHITVEPLRRLTARHLRELDEQVQRVGEVVEATPHLSVGEVSVGPHA